MRGSPPEEETLMYIGIGTALVIIVILILVFR